MLKSRLQKLDGLTHGELKENITKTIKSIPKDKYRNIIKGAYEIPEKYVFKKNKEELFMSCHITFVVNGRFTPLEI